MVKLPWIPYNKTALFTKRIIAFHETFASVGQKKKWKSKKNNISVLWHEGTAGRLAEAIASAYVKTIKQERIKKHIIDWADNCSVQYKNWILVTTLWHFMNSEQIDAEGITIKFFILTWPHQYSCRRCPSSCGTVDFLMKKVTISTLPKIFGSDTLESPEAKNKTYRNCVLSRHQVEEAFGSQ